jgi:hypothetical protein
MFYWATTGAKGWPYVQPRPRIPRRPVDDLRERLRKMNTVARLRSINVGFGKMIDWRGKRLQTYIWKVPVQGRLVARSAPLVLL